MQNTDEIIKRMARAIDLLTSSKAEMTCRDIAKAALEASGLWPVWKPMSEAPRDREILVRTSDAYGDKYIDIMNLSKDVVPYLHEALSWTDLPLPQPPEDK